MSVVGHVYDNFTYAALQKNINLASDQLNVALTTSSYTPNQGSDTYFSDVTNEVSGIGYTAGGQSLSGVTLTLNGTNHTVTLAASNTTWASSTITAATAVIYDYTSGASSSTRFLIAYQQSSANVSSSGGSFTIVWNASGILVATQS